MTEAPNESLFSIHSHSRGSPCTAVHNLHEVQLRRLLIASITQQLYIAPLKYRQKRYKGPSRMCDCER